MKKLFAVFVAVMLLVLCFGVSRSFAKGGAVGKTTFAMVDWERAAMEYNKSKKFDNLLNTLRDQEEKKVNELSQKLQPELDKQNDAIFKINKEYSDLLEKEKTGTKVDVQKKQKEKEYSILADGRDRYLSEAQKQLQESIAVKDKVLTDAQIKYTQEVIKDIVEAISIVARRNKIDQVLSKTPAGIVWTIDNLDITDEVLQELNK
ncbi:MAG: OmpH family outer membrane protein [Caldisericia bacterium]